MEFKIIENPDMPEDEFFMYSGFPPIQFDGFEDLKIFWKYEVHEMEKWMRNHLVRVINVGK